MRSDAVREVVGFAWEKNGKRARGGLESVKVEFFFFSFFLIIEYSFFLFSSSGPGLSLSPSFCFYSTPKTPAPS